MRHDLTIALALAVACSGCAAVPMRMHYGIEDGAAARTWPAPPEVPRYLHAGTLTGEDNFKPVEEESGLKRFGRWLVGLDESRANRVTLQRPQAGAVDAEGRVYVTDMSRQAVYVFDSVGGRLDVWDRAEPYLPFVAPIGIALGAAGQILVCDAELGRVFRLDGGGNPAGSFGAGQLQRPTGIARDPAAGLIYVSDTRAHDIKVFRDDGAFVRTLGRPGTGAGEFNAPTYLHYAAGRLYVTDTLNARVQALDADGVPIGTIGGRGLYVGNLTHPKGVAADGDGNVYVVESFYDHLLIYDTKGRYLLPISGAGADRFFLPAGVWVDDRDRVFIADMFNGRVLVLQYLGG